jgi:hypothetical protein
MSCTRNDFKSDHSLIQERSKRFWIFMALLLKLGSCFYHSLGVKFNYIG